MTNRQNKLFSITTFFMLIVLITAVVIQQRKIYKLLENHVDAITGLQRNQKVLDNKLNILHENMPDVIIQLPLTEGVTHQEFQIQ